MYQKWNAVKTFEGFSNNQNNVLDQWLTDCAAKSLDSGAKKLIRTMAEKSGLISASSLHPPPAVIQQQTHFLRFKVLRKYLASFLSSSVP